MIIATNKWLTKDQTGKLYNNTRLRPRYRSVSALALRAAGGFIPIDLCLPFNHQSLSCGRQGLPCGHQRLSFGHQGLTFGHLGLLTPSDTYTLE